ncbi:membrane-bound metal-dependent hydrolase [Nitrosococcus halophilus Nc 4]|uniref:Membrane-bound metal-dependent hydrolase n=1 Tax=Nitrosococcus halophilus (strain Nc4) TaxID=472759 RepID=D5C4Q7_NITHN|nr:metal-dependent hydrolase [Nitrosococcus halophilus]ADE13330.1 membrane-bound metal-dependent hydrolase [Nitrosococcus halophilus Nc 4]
MDIVTQGLLGAVVAQSATRSSQVRLAAAVGFVAGLLADADVFIRSAEDPLLTLEYHRQFTHSLLFVPIGGLIAAVLLWPFLRRRLNFGRLYGLATLGYLPSGLLDACTSYGTQLFWPVLETRIAWSLIAVVDPLFTGVLAIALGWSLFKSTPVAARLGLGLTLLYLLLGLVQQERVETRVATLAESRGHRIERLEAKPTLGNLILWRTIYESKGRFYVDAVRVGILSEPRIYRGGATERFTPKQLEGLQPGSLLAQDIERFTRFSDGFIAQHPEQPNILGDVRYAMLPTQLIPLWGIELDLTQQNQHVRFRTFRQLDEATRDAFLDMLLGRSINSSAPISAEEIPLE